MSKIRHKRYLPDDLSEAFDTLAAKPGNSKTAILADALPSWIDRKAVNKLDDRFAPRLDRQRRIRQRLESTLSTIVEVLDLFIQHQLTIVPHQPPFDNAKGQLGIRRCRAFMDQVARRVASH